MSLKGALEARSRTSRFFFRYRDVAEVGALSSAGQNDAFDPMQSLAASTFRIAASARLPSLCYPPGRKDRRERGVKRREFITVLGGAAAWPLIARAQQPQRMRRIGMLLASAESDPEGKPRIAAFQNRLQDLGWTDGRDIQFDYRWASGEADRLRMFAKELVDLQPDVIVGQNTGGLSALADATSTIPIVFVQAANPISTAHSVASLPRPGGNVTGFTGFPASTISAKWLEMLKGIAPHISRVALMHNPNVATERGAYFLSPAMAAAPSFALEPIAVPVHSAAEIEGAVTVLATKPGGGLVVMPDATTNSHSQLIIGLANHHRLPAIYAFRYIAAAGGLISYGYDPIDQFRRAASYVDRILRGEKPADLPIQQPDKLELVINLKTAKQLGLEVPDRLLALADHVID
jgi:putative ABC transport system substrate-binding protein